MFYAINHHQVQKNYSFQDLLKLSETTACRCHLIIKYTTHIILFYEHHEELERHVIKKVMEKSEDGLGHKILYQTLNISHFETSPTIYIFWP